jgi:uncharacterized glyoxalase superfamily protein PhnB
VGWQVLDGLVQTFLKDTCHGSRTVQVIDPFGNRIRFDG